MKIRVGKIFVKYIQKHRHAPMSTSMIPHYYVVLNRFFTILLFYNTINKKWYITTNPKKDFK